MLTLANAKVFDGTSFLPGTRNVTLDGNLIATVEEGSPPPGDDVIDVDGMTLMPGMITGHFHPDFYKYTPDHAQAGILIGNELPPGVLMAIAVRNCDVLLKSGFTGYLGASCSNEIDAQLQIAISEGIMRGPRIRPCGHHISTTGSVNDTPKWWLKTLMPGQDVFGDGPEEMRKLVREDIRRGARTIKIFASSGHAYPGAERPARNMAREEIAAVVNTAHDRGAKVRAHVSGREMLLECIELGVDILDHGDWIDEEIIEKMVKAGTYWVPSIRYTNIAIDLGMGDVEFMKAEFAHARRILPIAQEAGVKILIGDDYSGIFRDYVDADPLDHEVGNYGLEFAYYAELDGLSPTDVLAWGTKTPGELLSDGGPKVGVVESGALADLILVDADPTQDLAVLSQPDRYLRAVVRDGEFVINRLADVQAGNGDKASRGKAAQQIENGKGFHTEREALVR